MKVYTKKQLNKKLNKVYCIDAIEGMSKIPDKTIDLIVTSPPYNIGSKKNLGYHPRSTIGDRYYDTYDDDINDKKYCLWIIQAIRECLRVSRYVFWNVQFLKSTRSSILLLQNEFQDNLIDIFIWHKHAVSNITAKKSGGVAKGWEYVFMFGQGNLLFRYNNFPLNGYVPNIKTWFKSEHFKEHHATFPRSLPQYFIKYFTKEKDIVLDPFIGTGTTAVAAKLLGRNFIGFDIGKEYIRIARRRLADIPKINNRLA